MSWMKYNKETGQIDLLPYISELSGFQAIVMTNIHGILSARDQLQQLREKQKAERQSSLRISLHC